MAVREQNIGLSYRYLASKKRHQVVRFESLKRQFGPIYAKLRESDISDFTTDWWENEVKRLEAAFLPAPSVSFLRNPVILNEMFVAGGGVWLLTQLRYLESSLSKETLRTVLEEDAVGDPILMVPAYHTSHNAVHHLYHLVRYSHVTGYDLQDVSRVVEWGGGYGSVARILSRFISRPITYIGIDLPLLSLLQWMYLCSVVGPERVHLITGEDTDIREDCFNILPVSLLDSHEVTADLFISTWALSESSEHAQRYVLNRNWFDAERLLFGFQDVSIAAPAADNLSTLAKDGGALIQPIPFLPGNYYAFR